MRSKLLNSKVIFSLLLAGALVAEPFAIYADANINGADDAAFTCSSAINVMDCINQTQNPAVQQQSVGNLKTAIPVSNQTFGFSGPVSFNVRYDQDLSWILDAGYAQSFGNRAAIALKASAGQNELRGNGTIGFAISPKQQIKITYEYLTQNLPFDYAAGTVNEWVSQNAYGAAYRYMVGNNILQGIELSGSYTQANSKELSDIDLHDADGNFSGIDQRRIAGGQQKNGLASVILTPFKNTILKVGAGYSASSFDTKWSSDQAQSTVAYAVEATHLLTPKTLISTSVNNTSTNRAHTVKISRILPGNIEGNITGQYNVSHVDGIDSNANITAGLSYPAPKTYSNMFAGGIGDLKSWVQQPVIYNARVLAIAEEKILKAGISLKGAIPNSPMPVNDSFEQLYTIKTDDYFSYDKQVYSSMIYKITTYQADGKTPADLKLQMSPLDSYNFQITSSAPMPLNMLTSGATTKYFAVITAEGQRNGQTVTTVNSTPFEVDVTQNSGMPSATWANKPTLTGAVAGGSDYKSGPLATYVNGLDGEQFTFAVVPDSQDPKPTADDYTLKISDDGKYLTAKKIATNFTATTVKLTATSLASNKPVVIPNSSTPQQTFTIPLASAMKPPAVVPGVSLPDAVIGLPYGQTGKVDISKKTLLNPSLNQMKYLTKIYNGTTYIDDKLTFTRLHQSASDCAWLDFDQSSDNEDTNYGDYGNLYSTKVTAPSSGDTCDLTFRVDGTQTGTSATLTMQVKVRNQNYTAPQWTDQNLSPLVNAKSGSPLSFTLNPYGKNPPSPPLLTNTLNTDTQAPVMPADGTETLNTFKLNSISCTAGGKTVPSSWLNITDDGILQSQDDKGIPAVIPNSVPDNTTCSFKMTFYSTLAKGAGPTNADVVKYFSINGTSPAWNLDTVSQEMPYGDTNVPGIKLSDNVNIPDGQNKSDYLGLISYTYSRPKDLASGNNAIPDPKANPTYSTVSGVTYLKVTPTPKDIVAKDWVSDPANPYESSYGSIIAQAIYSKDGTSSPASGDATFNVRVTAVLKNPESNGTTLPNATLGSAYTGVQLNPFTSSLYMRKTQYKDINGNWQDLPDDKLDFSDSSSVYEGTSTPCWASVNPDTGEVTGTPTTDARTCTLNVKVKSARNQYFQSPVQLTIDVGGGTAPVWDTSKTTSSIKFDDTDSTTVNLNSMLQPGFLPNGLDFRFDDTNNYISSDKHWQIVPVTTSGVTTFYLRRNIYQVNSNNTIDANDIDKTNLSLKIDAFNAKTTTGKVLGSVAMTVTPDASNVGLKWVGDNKLIANYSNPVQSVFFPIENCNLGKTCLQTYLKNASTFTLIDDKLNMEEYGGVLQTPSGAVPTIYTDGSGYQILVPKEAFNANSYGVYPNASRPDGTSNQILLPNFSTRSGYPKTNLDLSKSGSLNQGGPLQLVISGPVGWSMPTSSPTLNFDAIVDTVAPASNDNTAINLSQYLVQQDMPTMGYTITKIDATSEDQNNATTHVYYTWKTYSKNGNWYLIRQGTSDPESGGRKIISVNDIDPNKDVTVTLTVAASDMVTSTTSIKVKLIADSSPSPVVMPRWDTSAQQSNLVNGGTKGLYMPKGSTIWPNSDYGDKTQNPTYDHVLVTGGGTTYELIKLCNADPADSTGNYCGDTYVRDAFLDINSNQTNGNWNDPQQSAILGPIPCDSSHTDKLYGCGSQFLPIRYPETNGNYTYYIGIGSGGQPNKVSVDSVQTGRTDSGPYYVVFQGARISKTFGTNPIPKFIQRNVRSTDSWLFIDY
jgi:hypothetical protein